MHNEADVNYTQAQLLTHLIDAAAMKSDIEHLKKSYTELNGSMLAVLTEIKAELRAMHESFNSVPRQIGDCRMDMRREIERDFPSKMESVRAEQRLETKLSAVEAALSAQISEVRTKADRQWLKISVVVSTIVAIGGLIQWFFVTYKALG